MAAPGSPIITDVPGGGQFIQAPIYDEQQMKIPAMLQQVGGAKLANPTQGFEPYEQYAQRLFAQQIVPATAERFTAGNNRYNSAFTREIGLANADLAARLGVARANYGLQNEQMGAQFLNQAMTPLYNQAYERPYSASGQIGANTMDMLTKSYAAYLEAPGNTIEEKIKNAFTGGKAAVDTVKAITGGGSSGTAGVADTAATAVDAVTAGKAAVDATKAATGTAVPKALTGAAAATAGGATAAGGAAATTGKTALVSGLKTAGAIVAPLSLAVAVGGLGIWILGEIAKGIYEDFTETGEFAKGKSKGV